MSSETTIRLDAEHDLLVQPHPDGVRLSLLPVREAPAHISFTVPTGELLRAIGAADRAALRESGRQLGEAWRDFTAAVREGSFGADR